MKILLLRDREPILIDADEFARLKAVIESGQREMVVKGNLVSLYGAQTYDSVAEVEKIYAKQQNKRQCSFKNWHAVRQPCTCPDGQLEAPLANMKILDEIKALDYSESLSKKRLTNPRKSLKLESKSK